MTDKSSLVAALQDSDWLIDLANVYDFWVPDYSVFEKVNVTGKQNLMEAALGITYTPVRVALEEAIAWYRG